jgi:hypothetical protein
MPDPQLQDISHTIQLAVAPVFLLSALGTILAVLSTRLGRIVDRARHLEGQPGSPLVREELEILRRRARLMQWAMTSATTAALMVCLLIAVAFLGFLTSTHLASLVAVMFIAALSGFVIALTFFLREVLMAIATLRIEIPAHLPADPPPAASPERGS